MAEFDQVRDKLAEARTAAQAAGRELFGARQELARLKRERQQASRSGTDLGALDQRIAAAEAKIGGLKTASQTAEQAEAGLFAKFVDFTDPRQHSGLLSDRIPVLLMPLRIETRFKTAAEIGGESDELWVRVYPDDISIDSFEPSLSQSEALGARAYWAEIWRASGNRADERGAWRVLMSGQGAGRSHWVIQTYRPLNEASRPFKADGVPTVILAIPVLAPLVDPEKTAVSNYWEALWRAGEDAAAVAAAEAALVGATGEARAAEIRKDYAPRNLADPPPEGATRQTTTVIVAYLEFPADEAVPVRESTWSQVPLATTLPDRLVLLGYNDGALTLERLGKPIPAALAVAPDPSAEEDNQLKPDGTDIKFGPELEWVADFNRAVQIGMGFRVPLSSLEFRRGFDSLMVLGLRMGADKTAGKSAFEQLIAHHHDSRAGFSLLPQGRPTNNVEGEGAAYSWQEDPDVSFDHYFPDPAAPAPAEPTGWFEKNDGRWLAELLGLDPAALAAIPFYARQDLSDARAMNVALWPATLGYFMDSMLHPVFEDDTVARTRDFFTRHVSARGQLPAIRVGKQPYGILPATPRSRIEWLFKQQTDPATGVAGAGGGDAAFLRALYMLLRRVEADFEPLLEKVSHIGKPGDAHQILLDVVGLHAGSVEFRQRYAESFDQLFNRLSMQGAGGAFLAVILALGYVQSGLALLAELGHMRGDREELPDILEKLFLGSANPLKGPLIDDRPLSETERIRAYTAAGANYIEWLIEAAGTSHDALRLQQGFTDRPNALLYLMLHHGLDLSFVETSVRLFAEAGILGQADLRAFRRAPKFLQVREPANPQAAGDISRWHYLYRSDAAVTGDPQRTVGQFIPTVLTGMQATAYLKRQLDALARLRDRPTAVLERAFTEHLDLCSYRLDAWYGGLMSRQLEELRYGQGQAQPMTGLYLGAYGWLEEVKPEHKKLTPVDLPADLAALFDPSGDAPPVSDSTNQGYIHAPSLNHAVTAAVLRNGYLSNATPANPTSLAVNLSSERVRMALSVIEGMKSEQSIRALLGYRFERGLHDRHDVEVDSFIYELRKAFPLVGDRLSTTRSGAGDEIRKIEARNVIDGLALVERMRETGNRTYPFGLGSVLPPASPGERDAISEEAGRIADLADAVADLAMAESVHQVVQGNYDRAGAVLDTYSKGKFPATPDVVRTPRSGVTLTHRVALHFETGLDPADAALASPRARAEPAVNAWLAALLPPPDQVACTVTVEDPVTSAVSSHTVTQAALGLLPIDLLYLLDPDNDRSGKVLDDLIEAHVVKTATPRADATLAIRYRDRLPAIPGHVPFFELTALIRPLRGMLLRARPLRATDMAMAQESNGTVDAGEALAPERITLPLGELAGHVGTLGAFQAALQGQLDASTHAQIVAEIDVRVEEFAGIMAALAPFAGLDTGTNAVFGDRRRIAASLRGILQAAIDRWDDRLDGFDQAIVDYDAAPAPTDGQKFEALLLAERLISTARTDPLPALPDDFRDLLNGASRAAFAGQFAAMAALHDNAETLADLHAGLQAAKLANLAFDAEPIDDAAATREIIALAEDMARRAATLGAELTARMAGVQGQLNAATAAAEARTRVAALTAAARLLFGEDFQILPDFALPTAQADEWATAWGAGATADTAILDHLKVTLGRRLPVEDWLAGVARVREKMHEVEAAGHLATAFTGAEIPLQPLQFPHRPDLPWLGLDYPQTKPDATPLVIDEDKLLYTAHFAEPFDASRRQAGLLLDEWTELIPARTEETGLAFHYDRPNSEPPQTLLLALPPAYTGGWRWQDLVDTVRETMDLAKKRAIEPDHIDGTAYARFLPAIVSATTLHPITATLNFAFNNNLAAALDAADGDGP